MNMARNHTTDFTAYSAVIVCERTGCMWRCSATARASAWLLYADHCRRAHADDRSAADARKRAGAPAHVS